MHSIAGLSSACLWTRYVQRKMDDGNSSCRMPLHDLGHALLPNLSSHERAIDALPMVLGCAVGLLALRGEVDAERVVNGAALLFFLRSVTMSVTTLPSPICTATRRNGSIGGCHDCIFSGHTALTLLFAYHIAQARGHRVELLVYCLAASALIVATRSHYTVDVLVAWLAVYALVKTL